MLYLGEHLSVRLHATHRSGGDPESVARRVYQEIWGILIAYNLVRLEMERAVDDAKVESQPRSAS